MYSSPQIFKKFLHYYLTASNGKGHGIHSPFVFDFVTKVLNDRTDFQVYHSIDNLRNLLIKNDTVIEVKDFGAGSAQSADNKRSIAKIARYASKRKKLGRLLFRICHYYKPSILLELGTSLGISAAYLASSNPTARLITIEGDPALGGEAKKNFEALGLQNTELIIGNFDDRLAPELSRLTGLDLVFLDGNHRKEPTLRYFSQLLEKTNASSIFIFDDIHWSSEMEECWELVKAHPRVRLTIDLFFMGIVFFRDEFRTKQHFVIRF